MNVAMCITPVIFCVPQESDMRPSFNFQQINDNRKSVTEQTKSGTVDFDAMHIALIILAAWCPCVAYQQTNRSSAQT